MDINSNPVSEPCLLNYFPSTRPRPIQVSSPGTPATGIVNTAVISPKSQAVYCNRIIVAVPVDGGGVFTSSPSPSASASTSRWAISAMLNRPGEELGFTEKINYSVFTFECRDPHDYQINYNLVLGLLGQVTETPGDFTIWISENSGTTSDPGTFTEKFGSFTIRSDTPQFYLDNFVTTLPTSPTTPATEFANGADIRFEWESNGTFFEVYQKGNSTPVYAGTQTGFTLSGGVARGATFVLAAMMTGNPSGDQPAGTYVPIYLYDSITVTIGNPDLTPRSANISGDASVGGALRFSNSLGDKIALWGQTGNNFGLGIQSSLLQIHTDTPAADVAFGSGSSSSFSETMRVKGNGHVGIGTNNPLSKLHIHGDYSNSGAGGFMLDASDTNDPELYVLRINPFVVAGAEVGYQFQTKSLSGGTNLPLAFDHAGNVGVGTASPGARLDVSGGAHIANDMNVGGTVSANNANVGGTLSAGTANVGGNLNVGGGLNIGDWSITCEHDGGWGSGRSSLHIRYQGVEIARFGPGQDDLQVRAVDQNLNSHGYFYFNQDGNSGFIGQ
jgi:hypothetical protein